MTNVNLDNNVNLNKIETENKISKSVSIVNNGYDLQNSSYCVLNDTSKPVKTSKGNVPASSLSFGSSRNPVQSVVISVTDIIKSYDNKDIQNILKNLDKLDFSKGINNIDDSVILALSKLGLDIDSKRGIVTITDSKGNVINSENFNELIDSIKVILQRTVTTNNTSEKSVDKNVDIDKEIISALSNTVIEHKKTMDYNDKVVEPLNNELKSNIEKFEALSLRAKQLSEKVDKEISEILVLKNQATSIINNSVSKTLTEIEKNQLKNIEQTILIKQQQLIKDSDLSQSLVKDINDVFSSFENKLNETEKETMINMKLALEKKIKEQSLTVRENFLASISEEIYKLTSEMSQEELKNVLENQDLRVKILSSNNKLLDKLMISKNISEFSNNELEEIMKKFKIKLVQEGNNLALYYTGGKDGKEIRVYKEELRQMKKDLNNIVTSPELFTLARSTGQISMAYSTNGNISSSSNNEVIKKGEKNKENIQVNKENKIYNNMLENNLKKENKEELHNYLENNNNDTKIVEQTFLQKSLEKKEKEDKYHSKKIEEIYEIRKEINKELEERRLKEKYGT